MSYGVVQEYFTSSWTLRGSQDLTGIIGTTFNGVVYLSMPILFAALSRRYARHRRLVSFIGAALTSVSFVVASLATEAWHLVLALGILAPLGCALVFSPATLSLGEWFSKTTSGSSGGGRRAVAYGTVLSCKNVVGSACPFLLRGLLDAWGFRAALRVWAILVACTCVPAVFLVPTHPSVLAAPSAEEAGEDGLPTPRQARKIPWHFLRHRTIYVYAAAIALQSSGYGIPQTYLNTYAHDVALVSQASATLLLTLFNIPGIAASFLFGWLSDNDENNNNNHNNNTSSTHTRWKRPSLSAPTATLIPALGSALAAFLFWGLATSRDGGMALLVLFSLTFGFFAGGYSATWGGVLNELEREAAGRNEAVDTGVLYGLLNGARGVGYVGGGLAGVPLLRAGTASALGGGFGYGTAYGPLIVFTGVSSVLGGWALLWRPRKLLALC